MKIPIPPDQLKQLFVSMLRIRRIEEAIAAAYPDQEMRCPVHLCVGQEAVAAGVCAALTPQDAIYSGHRAHGHFLAAGGDLKAFLAEIYGKATGCCRGKGGSMHLVDLSVGFMGSTPIVGGTLPLAVGHALGAKMQNLSTVVVVFFGDGATEEGVFHESLDYAQLRQLPVVFVCENNLYSVYSHLDVRQAPGRSATQVARGHGIHCLGADGNDVAAVHLRALEAIDHARSGKGPVLLEFETYRWLEHCGPSYDNHIGYRTEAEFLEWRARCPVARAQSRLEELGALSVSDLASLEEAIAREWGDALAFAQASPFPSEDTLSSHVYA